PLVGKGLLGLPGKRCTAAAGPGHPSWIEQRDVCDRWCDFAVWPAEKRARSLALRLLPLAARARDNATRRDQVRAVHAPPERLVVCHALRERVVVRAVGTG